MRQVLFHIPIYINGFPDGIPVFGYGMMLFVAFVVCTLVSGWRAEKVGIAREHLVDVAMWLFVFGILGARTVYIIQYHDQFRDFWQFFRIWDGGLVFYGCLIGGAVGYTFAHFLVLRKYKISPWK